MKSRIRVGALIINKNKLLLIKHVNPVTLEEFWLTPGGGMKKIDNNIFDCVKRETFEECGLKINLSKKIRFIHQWYDYEKDKFQLEIFLLTKSFDGNLTTDNLIGSGADEHWIKELRFFDEDEIKNINVFPKKLKNFEKLLKKSKKRTIFLK